MDEARTATLDLPGTYSAATAGGAERPRLLVADDVEANRFLLERYLAGDRWHLVFASDGDQVLSILRREPIDLALIDVEMPVRDGYATARAIREDADPVRRAVPLLALSAHDGPEYARRCREAGFDAVLSKPIPRRTVVAVVEEWLAQGRARARAIRSAPPRRSGARPARATRPVIVIDEDLLDIVQPFIDGRLDDVARMHVLLERGEFDRVRIIGHNLKGTGTSYGAPEVTRLGGAIEDAAERGDAGTIAEALVVLESFLRDVTIEARAV